FADRRPAGERYYLELDLGEDACAFLPLPPRQEESATPYRALLDSVDLRQQSAPAIIERQIGPFLHAMKALPKRDIAFTQRGRGAGHDPATAIVMPLLDKEAPLRVTLAEFGIRRLSADEQLVFVCPEDDALLRSLEQLLGFYELRARIVVTQ